MRIIPEKAVDQHEVRWYTISEIGVIEHRAVYHVNTAWGAAEQTRELADVRNGADFVDINGRFIGWA